uniref:Cadherin domain-containing protein n=1 Tax=Syphacia muris TaxID=451379 RepID=A0A158R4W7_9BILA
MRNSPHFLLRRNRHKAPTSIRYRVSRSSLTGAERLPDAVIYDPILRTKSLIDSNKPVVSDPINVMMHSKRITSLLRGTSEEQTSETLKEKSDKEFSDYHFDGNVELLQLAGDKYVPPPPIGTVDYDTVDIEDVDGYRSGLSNKRIKWSDSSVFSGAVALTNSHPGSTLLNIKATLSENISSVVFSCSNPKQVSCYTNQESTKVYRLRVVQVSNNALLSLQLFITAILRSSQPPYNVQREVYTVNFMKNVAKARTGGDSNDILDKFNPTNKDGLNIFRIPVAPELVKFNITPDMGSDVKLSNHFGYGNFEKTFYDAYLPEGITDEDADLAIIKFTSPLDSLPPSFEITDDPENWFKIGNVNTALVSQRFVTSITVLQRAGVDIDPGKTDNGYYNFTLKGKQDRHVSSATIRVEILTIFPSRAKARGNTVASAKHPLNISAASNTTDNKPLRYKKRSKKQTTAENEDSCITTKFYGIGNSNNTDKTAAKSFTENGQIEGISTVIDTDTTSNNETLYLPRQTKTVQNITESNNAQNSVDIEMIEANSTETSKTFDTSTHATLSDVMKIDVDDFSGMFAEKYLKQPTVTQSTDEQQQISLEDANSTPIYENIEENYDVADDGDTVAIITTTPGSLDSDLNIEFTTIIPTTNVIISNWTPSADSNLSLTASDKAGFNDLAANNNNNNSTRLNISTETNVPVNASQNSSIEQTNDPELLKLYTSNLTQQYSSFETEHNLSSNQTKNVLLEKTTSAENIEYSKLKESVAKVSETVNSTQSQMSHNNSFDNEMTSESDEDPKKEMTNVPMLQQQKTFEKPQNDTASDENSYITDLKHLILNPKAEANTTEQLKTFSVSNETAEVEPAHFSNISEKLPNLNATENITLKAHEITVEKVEDKTLASNQTDKNLILAANMTERIIYPDSNNTGEELNFGIKQILDLLGIKNDTELKNDEATKNFGPTESTQDEEGQKNLMTTPLPDYRNAQITNEESAHEDSTYEESTSFPERVMPDLGERIDKTTKSSWSTTMPSDDISSSSINYANAEPSSSNDDENAILNEIINNTMFKGMKVIWEDVTTSANYLVSDADENVNQAGAVTRIPDTIEGAERQEGEQQMWNEQNWGSKMEKNLTTEVSSNTQMPFNENDSMFDLKSINGDVVTETLLPEAPVTVTMKSIISEDMTSLLYESGDIPVQEATDFPFDLPQESFNETAFDQFTEMYTETAQTLVPNSGIAVPTQKIITIPKVNEKLGVVDVEPSETTVKPTLYLVNETNATPSAESKILDEYALKIQETKKQQTTNNQTVLPVQQTINNATEKPVVIPSNNQQADLQELSSELNGSSESGESDALADSQSQEIDGEEDENTEVKISVDKSLSETLMAQINGETSDNQPNISEKLNITNENVSHNIHENYDVINISNFEKYETIPNKTITNSLTATLPQLSSTVSTEAKQYETKIWMTMKTSNPDEVIVPENAKVGDIISDLEISVFAEDMDPTDFVVIESNLTAFSPFPRLMQPGKTVFLIVSDPSQLDYESSPKSFSIEIRASMKRNPSVHTSKVVVIQKKDESDQPPTFKETTYVFHVLESSITGQKVGQLEVSDSDSIDQGKLNYRLIGPGSTILIRALFITHYLSNNSCRFTINGGIITLSCMTILPCLDREHTESYHLIVVATDQGGLSSVPASVEIMVDDENDNAPHMVFSKSSIEISDGRIVQPFLVKIVDLDQYPNNVNELIVVGNASAFINFEKIHENLYYAKLAVLPAAGQYALELMVRDKFGAFPENALLKQSIVVTVHNTVTKAHFKRNKYERTINSEKLHKGNPLVQPELEGASFDTVRFVIFSGDPGWLMMDQYSGNIFVGELPVNGVDIGHYEITIAAIDRVTQQVVDETKLLLTVRNNARKSRIFDKKLYNVTISKDVEQNFVTVKLFDKGNNEDRSAINIYDDVIYGIDNNLHIMEIPKNAVILTNGLVTLDMSVMRNVLSLNFRVVCRNDFAIVFIRLTSNPKKVAAQLKEDSRPIFIHPWKPDFNIIQVKLTEESPIGSILFTLPAFNPVNGNAVTDIHLSGAMTKYFSINTTTGDIIVNEQLDYDTAEPEKRVFELDVIAGQVPYETVAKLRVELVDIDDNPPKLILLEQYNLEKLEVSEKASPGTTLFEVQVSDPDYLYGKHDKFKYKLSGEGSNNFQVKENNDTVAVIVSPAADLDYNKFKTILITLKVQDSGGNSDTIGAVISVLDANNNAPIFNPREYSVVAVENWPTDTALGIVMATDLDSEQNGQIQYKLINRGAEYFKVDANTGVVSIARSLIGLARAQPYEVTITATDLGNSPLSTSTTMKIHVIESALLTKSGDNKKIHIVAPSLGYTVVLDENIPANHRVYTVIARIGDFSDQYEREVKYSIEPVDNKTDANWFSIDSSSGDIYTVQSLDYEQRSAITVLHLFL